MNIDIQSYNDLQSVTDKEICNMLVAEINSNLNEAERLRKLQSLSYQHPICFPFFDKRYIYT
ncbi:hypothetical protein [Pedobacter gandavensis]|uniref:Uncharacterized protein n=1 Tax=Pedobacter gandavensis TaxID=2679963 RepID=A0ABR6EZD7_9SPHI|nr:hypothetical protein [Pedobacter gandavensis]MBB2150536.1 hypothetical protein [Pedobacter gandavensis]